MTAASLTNHLPAPRVMMLALIAAVFLLGGGARSDIESLAVLRPLAFAMAAAGVLMIDRDKLAPCRLLIVLLAALALLMIVQLIPLPPAMWSALPVRGVIYSLDQAVGLTDHWRPLTLSPSRTTNALASLAVPFAALILFAQLDQRGRRDTLTAIVLAALLSATMGVVQQLSDPTSGLFLYEVTNHGSAVGLFANRNHHAVFLCCAILIALHLANDPQHRTNERALLLGSALVLYAAVLANGSRAGVVALGLVTVMILLPTAARTQTNSKGRSAMAELLPVGIFAVAAALFATFAMFGRSEALSRLLGDTSLEEYRSLVLPELVDMAMLFQPWGSGYGTFEYAFRILEPAELVRPGYFNQAHNDWLQWPIEGGIGGLVIAAALAVWLGIQVSRLSRASSHATERNTRSGWLGLRILLLLAVASAVDYPLRVPSIMALATIALALVAQAKIQLEAGRT